MGARRTRLRHFGVFLSVVSVGRPLKRRLPDDFNYKVVFIMKKISQLEIVLSYGAIILLLFGAFFLNSTPEPKTYQEILNQATGHRPIMSNGYDNFHSFLRIYIFSISLNLIYLNYQIRKMRIIYGFILIGIIFNPILLLYLNIETWKILDFFASLFFAYYLFSIHRSNKKIIMEGEAAERREK